MGKLVLDNPDRLLSFVRYNFVEPVQWERSTTFGWEVDGNLVAVAAFNQFHWPSISGHIVSDGSKRWASRPFLHAIFDYPFRQLECRRISAPVAEGNHQAITFLERLGFVLEGRLRKALPDGRNRLIYGILKEECKWI